MQAPRASIKMKFYRGNVADRFILEAVCSKPRMTSSVVRQTRTLSGLKSSKVYRTRENAWNRSLQRSLVTISFSQVATIQFLPASKPSLRQHDNLKRMARKFGLAAGSNYQKLSAPRRLFWGSKKQRAAPAEETPWSWLRTSYLKSSPVRTVFRQ